MFTSLGRYPRDMAQHLGVLTAQVHPYTLVGLYPMGRGHSDLGQLGITSAVRSGNISELVIRTKGKE